MYEFLHGQLEEVQVSKQFVRGRIRADIVVGDTIIIELKNNLDTTTKYQRLVGQLVEYESWKGPVFVVLYGKTDPNLRKQLKRHIDEKTDYFDDFRLLEKESPRARRGQNP
jgi:hypothetical protein